MPLNFAILLSSTTGGTIVVAEIDDGIVIVITDDIDEPDEESCAIPSWSYCERAIDGTTSRIRTKN